MTDYSNSWLMDEEKLRQRYTTEDKKNLSFKRAITESKKLNLDIPKTGGGTSGIGPWDGYAPTTGSGSWKSGEAYAALKGESAAKGLKFNAGEGFKSAVTAAAVGLLKKFSEVKITKGAGDNIGAGDKVQGYMPGDEDNPHMWHIRT